MLFLSRGGGVNRLYGGRGNPSPTVEMMLFSRRGVCFKLNIRRRDVPYCYDNCRGRRPRRPAKHWIFDFFRRCNKINLQCTGDSRIARFVGFLISFGDGVNFKSP